MGYRLGLAIGLFASLISVGSSAFAGDASPEYSPLPPPPAPAPGANEVKPVARPAAARPAPATPAPATTTTTTTTTTSASLPSSAGGTPTSPPEPDGPANGKAHTSNLDDERFSIAPFLGFGTNNLDLGIGARAGLVVGSHVWVGGTFVYHAGTSTSGIVSGVPYGTSTSMFYVGPEAGYDFELGPVILRPYAGIGIGSFTASTTGNPNATLNVSDTQTKLLVWPGVTALYGFPGGRFFVGGDTRVISVPNGPALAAYGMGGVSL